MTAGHMERGGWGWAGGRANAMPARFTVVSAPLEERVGNTLLDRLRDLLEVGAQLNATAHNATAVARLRHAVVDSTGVHSLPVFLVIVGIVALAFQQVIITAEARNMLNQHRNHQPDDPTGAAGSQREKCE